MIRKVKLRRFKRFEEEEFNITNHIVLAGPNNTGKTTLLQAIAAWSLAFLEWKKAANFQRRGMYSQYAKAPITRQTFSAVPLLKFDFLWNNRDYTESIEIQIITDTWDITMELIPDSTEQIYVRPLTNLEPADLKSASFETVYVPPMTGLSTTEPVYQKPKLNQLLGQGKPGDIIRNLLVEAYGSATAWAELKLSIKDLFGFELLPPNSEGADILAEYRMRDGGASFDIASAGSGFQQILMLLTFLHTKPASILLLDEPDAHLHIILQEVIYDKLRSVAVRQKSQLIMATHSEIIINAVPISELCMLFDRPRPVETEIERQRAASALGILSHADIMLALETPGVLYLEDYTDLNILREWARILSHPAQKTLTTNLFWKKIVFENRFEGEGIKSRDHYNSLILVRPDLPGLELRDGDSRDIGETPITGQGFQKIRWKRYEIESYLLHPDALSRYVIYKVGSEVTARIHVEDLNKHFSEKYPPAFLKNPFEDEPYLISSKARTDLLPPALTAAGLPGIDYTSYYEIAALMKPEEIHPEVIEKLNAIQRAFRL